MAGPLWLIYGANGYTGQRIAQPFAVIRGKADQDTPWVSPRNVAKTPAISSSLGSGGTAT